MSSVCEAILYMIGASLIHSIHSYHFVNIHLNWSLAELYCQDVCNSNLASIHSESDFDAISSILNQSLELNRRAWFGLNDIVNELDFVYTDGTPFNFGNNTSTPGNYPWTVDSPADDSSNGNQDCCNLIRRSPRKTVFNDDECYETYPFICNTCINKTTSTFAPSETPSVSPTIPNTCGDYQCIIVSGLGQGFDGSWRANGGYNCIAGKSYYTNEDLPGTYLCLARDTHWTFTNYIDIDNETCGTDTNNRLAYCTKIIQEISYCTDMNAWKVSDGNGSYIDVSRMVNLNLSDSLCPTIAPSVTPTENPTISPTQLPTKHPSIPSTNNPTTAVLTYTPSYLPTVSPTHVPSKHPSISPSTNSTMPSAAITLQPTIWICYIFCNLFISVVFFASPPTSACYNCAQSA